MNVSFDKIKSEIIFGFIKVHYKNLFFATALSLVGGACGAIVITIIGRESGKNSVIFAPIAYVASCFLMIASRSFSEILLMKISQAVVVDLRMYLSKKILSARLSVLRDIGKASLLSIITEDVGAISSSFLWMPTLASNIFILLACLICMYFVSWQVSLFLIFCMILGAGSFYLLERGPLREMAAIRAKGDILFRNFRDLIDGVRELQINSKRGEFFVDKIIFNNANSLSLEAFSNSKNFVIISNFGGAFFYGVIGVIVFIAPIFLRETTHSIFMATLISMYSIGPISVVIGSINAFGRLGVALKRISNINSKLSDDFFSEKDVDIFKNIDGKVVFEMQDISYKYSLNGGEDGFRLGPISITAKSGEVLFFVGGNGSGKTTLSMLILGLCEPESGRICLNGVEVHNANRAGYRQNFSAVLSDFHLFEHVGVGGDDALDEAMFYINAFGLSNKVSVKDGKFSTIDLSSGQRRRLALISSCLEDRPIYLFDEWAADQDPESKDIFYNKIIHELKGRGKIVMVVTHDDRYFACADRVIRLEGGVLTEGEMVGSR